MWSSSFLFSLVLFVISTFLMISGVSISFSWTFPPGFEIFDSLIMLDETTFIFMSMVGLVSFSVFVYFNSYMKESKFKNKFSLGMLFFLMSMVLLSTSGDILWMMVGWDGLGLSSFYLIVYFQNWKSFNSSMVTFLSNRLGDSLIMMYLCMMMGEVGGSKFISHDSLGVISLLFLLGSLTKSAQFPFSSWLPLAMAAPTPVSALVHSSTLVTAGVYVMIRFHSFFSEEVKMVSFVLSGLTIILAGSSSIGEYDLKKIIALSTLSNVGLMVMFLSMGMQTSATVHLVIHSLFKSLLFMIAGDLIHSNLGNQDIRSISFPLSDYSLGVCFLTSCLSMMGAPFMSGFFAKEELLMSLSSKLLWVSLFLFVLSVFLTSSYSVRLVISVFSPKFFVLKPFTSSSSSSVFVLMTLFSCFGGLVLFLLSKGKGVSLSLFSTSMKSGVLIPLVLGVFFASVVVKFQGILRFIHSFHYMWSLDSSFKVFQGQFFVISYFKMYKFDKGVMDFLVYSKGELLLKFCKETLARLLWPPLSFLGVLITVLFFPSYFVC